MVTPSTRATERNAMRLGINLRGDLTKLDDAAIAAMFEQLIAQRAAADQAMDRFPIAQWFYRIGLLFPSGRGLLRAAVFYKYRFTLFEVIRWWNVGGARPPLKPLFLLDCELKDVRDDLGRRVRAKQVSAASATS
jgi:hypothetical protein